MAETLKASGVMQIPYGGYSNCLLIQNATTRVVLCPQCGGRVLEYTLGSEDVIYFNPEENGRTWKSGEPIFQPSGGRFDIGPEKLLPPHPTLWLGSWEVEVTGPRSVRLTSHIDPTLGIRLVREFVLDSDSPHLTCTQTILNRSDRVHRLCYWGRTLAKGGGIVVIPVGGYSRFPKKYVQYGPGPWIQYEPEDPGVKFTGNFVKVIGPLKEPKLGFDFTEGWLAYLMQNGLAFVKSFPVFSDRIYNEIAGLTLSIVYEEMTCELQPIGPMEILRPSASASFTEEWWLIPFPFPEDGESVDLEALEEAVRNEL